MQKVEIKKKEPSYAKGGTENGERVAVKTPGQSA